MKQRLARGVLCSALGAAMLITSRPASAWGPTTQTAIVTTAVHVLAQDRSLRLLVSLREYVRQGSQMSAEEQAELFPNFQLNPVALIEREMVLLQTVKSRRIDPYFAYRLGTLGTLVAEISAPMTDANPVYRDAYYDDVDRRMSSGRAPELSGSERLLVDPQAYFQRIRREAATQDTTIEVDYRTGEGFAGFAGAALPQDMSRSISAVADVWHTIFSNSVAGLSVAPADVRAYFLRAIKFHLNRTPRSLTEASETLESLREARLLDADTYKAVGDLYFDANEEERAMRQYEAALTLEPGRRDVMDKVAIYYVQKGEKAEQEKRLEDAAAAFSAAQQANPLHPDAQRKLIGAEDAIEEREARLNAARTAINEGDRALTDAESAALNRNYAEAITRLRVAQREYNKVTNEFPVEAERAQQAGRNAELLMREYKGDLIVNAQSLSGTGFSAYARELAQDTGDIGEEALRSMLDREFREAVQALRQELQESLVRTP